MGEPADTIRPIWRTPLAVVLVAWMSIVVGVTLAAPRLMETAPPVIAPAIVLAVYLVPPPMLLVWSLWSMLREPVTGWMAPTMLMAFLGGFVPIARPLYDAGMRLNFASHKPVYDEIVQVVARAPRLTSSAPGGDRWILSDGAVRYRYRPSDPGAIDFIWFDGYGLRVGVHYDDSPCVARRGRVCIDYGEPLGGGYTHFTRLY